MLGGGSSVNAQVYMRGPPVGLRRLGRHPARQQRRGRLVLGHGAEALPGDGGQQPPEQRLPRRRRPDAGLGPRPHRPDVALVRAGRAGDGRALQPRFQRPLAARRRLLPVHEPAWQAISRRLCLPRAAGGRPPPDPPPAIPRRADHHREWPRRGRRLARQVRHAARTLTRGRDHRHRRRADHAQAAHALRSRPRRPPARARDRRHRSTCPASART